MTIMSHQHLVLIQWSYNKIAAKYRCQQFDFPAKLILLHFSLLFASKNDMWVKTNNIVAMN